MGLTRYHIVVATTVIAALAVCVATAGWVQWTALTGVCFLGGLTVGLGVSFPQWQMFGRSLCRINTGRRVVALTFDDGPDPVNTSQLLALLNRREVRATFFLVGNRASRHPEVVRQVSEAGHQIENHTLTHDRWTNLFSIRRLREDIEQAQQVLKRLTGSLPTCIRTPAGLTNPRIFRVARSLNLTVVGYTARGRDQSAHSAEQVVKRLTRGVRPGAILLMHDSGIPMERLLQTVEMLLDRLQSSGYECLRLDELMALEGKR